MMRAASCWSVVLLLAACAAEPGTDPVAAVAFWQQRERHAAALAAHHNSGTQQIASGQSAAATAAAALAPPGGLPLSLAQQPSPRLLFMAALADMAYTREFGTGAARAPVTPCLQAWGMQGEAVVVDSVDPAGGVSHCTVFRTHHDVFVLFRGLDELQSIFPVEADTALVPAAEYFGLPNGTDPSAAAAAASSAAPGAAGEAAAAAAQPAAAAATAAAGKQGSGTAAGEVAVLRGFLRAHQAMEPLYVTQISKLASQLPPPAQASYRVWLLGHSDGSSLAQIAALRLAFTLGPAKLGGVLLFGTQRVGSPGFAAAYNRRLGSRTLRWQYGWDPATEVLYPAGDGRLALTGAGFAACPVAGQPLERLVATPLGHDVAMVCGEAAPAAAHDSDSSAEGAALLLHAADAVAAAGAGVIPGAGGLYRAAAAAAGAGVARGGSDGSSGGAVPAAAAAAAAAAAPAPASSNGLLELRFLAHHMPALFFDGLLRVLAANGSSSSSNAPGLDPATLAALRHPACVVSSKCAAALRGGRDGDGAGGRCATCASAATCGGDGAFWPAPAGPKCDAWSPRLSGFLCYGSWLPPGLLGLLGVFGGGGGSSSGEAAVVVR